MMSPAVGMLHSSHSAYRAGRHSSTLDPAGIVLVTPLTGACATVRTCGLTIWKSAKLPATSFPPVTRWQPTDPDVCVLSSADTIHTPGSGPPTGHARAWNKLPTIRALIHHGVCVAQPDSAALSSSDDPPELRYKSSRVWSALMVTP